MRFTLMLRALFHIQPEDPLSKPVRVIVTDGEHAGQYGWCCEARRLVEPGNPFCIPVDLDGGRHVHLSRDQVEIVQ